MLIASQKEWRITSHQKMPSQTRFRSGFSRMSSLLTPVFRRVLPSALLSSPSPRVSRWSVASALRTAPRARPPGSHLTFRPASPQGLPTGRSRSVCPKPNSASRPLCASSWVPGLGSCCTRARPPIRNQHAVRDPRLSWPPALPPPPVQPASRRASPSSGPLSPPNPTVVITTATPLRPGRSAGLQSCLPLVHGLPAQQSVRRSKTTIRPFTLTTLRCHSSLFALTDRACHRQPNPRGPSRSISRGPAPAFLPPSPAPQHKASPVLHGGSPSEPLECLSLSLGQSPSVQPSFGSNSLRPTPQPYPAALMPALPYGLRSSAQSLSLLSAPEASGAALP